MKRIRFSSIMRIMAVVVVLCSILFSCTQTVKELKVVTFSGCEFMYIGSLSGPDDFFACPDSGEMGALLLSDGDLLFTMVGNENDEFDGYLKYKSEYGQHLEISLDSVYSGFVRVNGEISTINLGSDSVLNDWNEIAASEDLTDLMLIQLRDIPGEHTMNALEIIARENPKAGLYFDTYDSLELFYDIISLFQPAFLVIPELDSRIEKLIPNLQNLESVILSDKVLKYLDLSKLPALKSLNIMFEDSTESMPVQFEDLKSLESLTLNEADWNSMEHLGKPKRLHSLYLKSCDSLFDISQLKELQNLQCLGISDCDCLADFKVLTEIPSLQWLSFPTQITQEDFDQIIGHNKSLQGIELMECDCVKDLTSLIHLEDLKALTIALPEIDFNSLKQLTGIELIIIGGESVNEEDLEALKEALPDTHIVPGGGFCMGSGWILLLLPVLLLAFGYRRFIRN